MALLPSISRADPANLLFGLALSAVGYLFAHLRRSPYDTAADREERVVFWLVYGRPLLVGAGLAALSIVIFFRIALATVNPADPWHRELRPRGWGCIFRTGEIVNCSKAAALEAGEASPADRLPPRE